MPYERRSTSPASRSKVQKRYLEDLSAILTGPTNPDLALIGSFRSLVEGVVVQPRKAGEEYEVNIRGHLAALMGVEVSALQMVAGGRFI